MSYFHFFEIHIDNRVTLQIFVDFITNAISGSGHLTREEYSVVLIRKIGVFVRDIYLLDVHFNKEPNEHLNPCVSVVIRVVCRPSRLVLVLVLSMATAGRRPATGSPDTIYSYSVCASNNSPASSAPSPR